MGQIANQMLIEGIFKLKAKLKERNTSSFREQRRKKNMLSEEAVLALLEAERRGVLAVNGDEGYPYAIPINYIYDEDTARIYFHGSKVGHKIDSIKKDSRVCFTVYGNEFRKEGEWAPYVQSVVAFGRCRLVEDEAETLDKLRKLGMKYYPTSEEVEELIKSELQGVQVFAIEIEHLTGKQIQER